MKKLFTEVKFIKQENMYFLMKIIYSKNLDRWQKSLKRDLICVIQRNIYRRRSI